MIDNFLTNLAINEKLNLNSMNDYLQKAKDYWREHGYSQGAVKSIAYFMEEIENLRIEGERQYRQIRELEDEMARLRARHKWDDGPGWGPGK